jgi:hypothetical protein
MLSIERTRSPKCVSGHVRWELEPIDADAEQTTLGELFGQIESLVGMPDVQLQPWLHAVCTEAACACGLWRHALGTEWLPPPSCERCGQSMHWFHQTALSRISREASEQLHISGRTLGSLGLPTRGAMIAAHAPHQPPRYFVLS